MKRHQPNKRLSDKELSLVRQAKRAPSADAHWNTPQMITSLIAVGKITRENSCDGKARFRTYEYADGEARPALEQRHNTHLEVYACVFCGGWHMATREEFAA